MAQDANRSQSDGESVDGQSNPGAEDASRAVGEPAGVSAAALAAEAAELRAELDAARSEAEERLRGWQRTQADHENYKKWALQEMANRARTARSSVLLDLLEVVDDFERALAADPESDAEAWLEGVRLIERKFYHFLEQKELSPIAAEGQPFDPHFHEAMGQAPGPEGRVIAQLQKGYLLGDRVLRPARVIVGTGEPGAPADDPRRTQASEGETA